MPLTGFTIGQVSEKLGVPVPTLRSWHRRYGVALPLRTEGGHRRYSAADVRALQELATAVTRGIAPRLAARAVAAAADDALPLLPKLLAAATAGDQQWLEATLDESAAQHGLEATLDRLLLPALHEVGRLWELDEIGVDVEHLATTASRRWIARGRASRPARSRTAHVLLAAGPGNEHTVALEAFGLVLAHRGWTTRELGANTPVPSILNAADNTHAKAAVVTAHQVSRKRGAVSALHALAERGIATYYAGAAFDSPGSRMSLPGTYLGTSLVAAATKVEQEVRSVMRAPRPGGRRPSSSSSIGHHG